MLSEAVHAASGRRTKSSSPSGGSARSTDSWLSLFAASLLKESTSPHSCQYSGQLKPCSMCVKHNWHTASACLQAAKQLPASPFAFQPSLSRQGREQPRSMLLVPPALHGSESGQLVSCWNHGAI